MTIELLEQIIQSIFNIYLNFLVSIPNFKTN